ncbi:hypothetical protein EJ08DRAFT_696124 [Tothia fuscella]|uniref:Uncharacterized protein n=1 Tax=Tothia fuscella TaxID=1048955 RepID=A0A9P4TZG9_9PEZI|nr:hypothetical protein EJ08DRAFT_696124 [Tothia fuscella]
MCSKDAKPSRFVVLWILFLRHHAEYMALFSDQIRDLLLSLFKVDVDTTIGKLYAAAHDNRIVNFTNHERQFKRMKRLVSTGSEFVKLRRWIDGGLYDRKTLKRIAGIATVA